MNVFYFISLIAVVNGFSQPCKTSFIRAVEPSCRSSHGLKGNSRSNLHMHMGHSHSHHHQSDKEDEIFNSETIPKFKPTTLRGKILYQITQRKVSRVIFAALATLLPPLLMKSRRLGRADWALFGLTSTTLMIAEGMRREVKNIVNKAKGLRDGFIKHAPSTIDPQKYLFQNDNAADRVTLVGVVINLFLSVGKGIVGIQCHSSALVADAGHSLSDLFSDFITLWAVQIARLPPDDDHPYGHGKFEAVGSLFLALTLFGTGISIGMSSNTKLLQILQATNPASVTVPTSPALFMAALSIFSKEWLYRITRRVGEELNSQVVIANAWHHRSDAYSSILALASIGLAIAVPGMAFADAAAGLLVAGMICMTGAEILGESVKQLTDTSDPLLIKRIKNLVLKESDDIVKVNRVRARWMGSSAIVDLEVSTRGNLSTSANRAVEDRIRYRIMDTEPVVIDADVHAVCDTIKCPLLTASAVKHETKSAQELEENARRQLLNHKEVESVELCTVHFHNPLVATVDANIRLKNMDANITTASIVAKELRDLLEESRDIQSARIFLDLNDVKAPVPK